MAPVSSTWNGDSDRDLLLTLIDQGGPSTAKWPLIADEMQAKGYTFTKEACRQHFQKIRKEGKFVGSSAAPGATAVPRPRAPKGTSPAKFTPRKGKSMTDSFPTTNGSSNGYADDDDDNVHDDFTPLKRKRTMKKEEDDGQSAPIFKIEGQGVETKPIDLEREELYQGFDDDEQYT